MAAEQPGRVELRAYCFIDRMQPQWAALNGTTVSGDIPVAGMAELLIELAPGNEVFRIADVALKATEVKPGSMIVEREFGMLELHAFNQEAVREAGRAILETLGLGESDRHAPRVASTQLITNVDPYEAQLINRFRRGAMLVPGETLFILEVAPAAYVSLAANEAEKASNIKVVNVSNVGRFGRMFLSGSEAEALNAQQASVRAIEALAQPA